MDVSERLGMYAGFLYQPVFLVFTLTSIYLHPGFNLREHAVSDLGAMGVENAWIFNVGVLMSCLLGIIFALLFLRHLPRPFGSVGIWLTVSSALFFIVAVVPDNAPIYIYGDMTVHRFFAITGFTIGSIIVLLFAIFWILTPRWRVVGAIMLIICFLPALAWIYGGPGIAMFELVFSFAVLVWSYLSIFFGVRCGGSLNVESDGHTGK
ncbi:MAG: DUF998 domain-containing protein [Euryarchaeota archaeon]|uniref:Hypothetical membrane protein n=1 Tax=uncultured euryarchaeote Alv-FOS4 TaxID=337893 RepID=Q3SA92_9EURY|nr:hypothetical membrane protein [uncultured euryarchaeote Alv-FOS4]NPA75035.1 DUF998 domain-containing protein [Euryarchaeota archaeon]